MIGISVLGSTGSVGKSTLDVLSRHPDRFKVVALAANSDVEGLYQQCLQFRPQMAAMADEASAKALAERLSKEAPGIEVLGGAQAVVEAARHPDAKQVMAAIVGAAGLLPALAAVRAGKRLLLANKEVLVVAGQLFMAEAKQHGVEILPIDSEHNALFQCMPRDGEDLPSKGISKILLTASGGPFRRFSAQQLADVTPEQACAHPNWSMGRKISVDSASLMNKGLEVIEAHWLFNASPKQIQVVVHPQSIIHSLVQYVDGSVLAQLGNPDMRTPIAHALAWPERIPSGVAELDLFQVAQLDFERPDLDKFPCLRLAFDAIQAGGALPAILNAANEVAVDRFLRRQIGFTQIAELNERVMSDLAATESDGSLQSLLNVDRLARDLAEQTASSLVS